MVLSAQIDGSFLFDSGSIGAVYGVTSGVDCDYWPAALGQPRRLSSLGFPPAFDSSLEGALLGKQIFSNAYFCHGAEYVRYDWTTGHRSPTYLKVISTEWHATASFIRDFDGVIFGQDCFSAGQAIDLRKNWYNAALPALSSPTNPAAAIALSHHLSLYVRHADHVSALGSQYVNGRSARNTPRLKRPAGFVVAPLGVRTVADVI